MIPHLRHFALMAALLLSAAPAAAHDAEIDVV